MPATKHDLKIVLTEYRRALHSGQPRWYPPPPAPAARARRLYCRTPYFSSSGPTARLGIGGIESVFGRMQVTTADLARPGPTTRRASRDDERMLNERRRSSDSPFDGRSVAGSSLVDLDLAVVRSTYLPAVVDAEVIEENQRSIEQQLASMRLSDLAGVPTVLGLLIAGFDPSNYLPGAYIQFVRYQGDDLGAAVADDQEIRAHLIDSSVRLESVLRGNLRTRIIPVRGLREAALPDYPFNALREVCMNAIMHRNYESSYAPVRIAWFESRIEVSNPGGPFGQVRSENFDRVNDYRNPSLAAVMKSLGYVNRFGRGVARIRAALDRNGNPPAEFAVDDSSWTVTLRSNI